MSIHPPPPAPDGAIALPTDDDGIKRRGFLKCMAWAGTGMLWSLHGGVFRSTALTPAALDTVDISASALFFMQISDSHIGFTKGANPDVTATLQAAVAKINALPTPPAFVLHTGDITQLAKASEFDTAQQVLTTVRTDTIFYVPGEHDVGMDNGAGYLDRYGKHTQRGTTGGGWYSFDHSGVHFIGLVNVLNLKAGGLGSLGAEQLAWLKRDVAPLSSSTPIVVFAHVPLWTISPEWGWGTEDSAQALACLKRFGSVTVLNGHIHQTMQKVEGHVAFHTALSTAFPQPAPGTAPAPGPMTVPADRLGDVLGIRQVHYLPHAHSLAVVDQTLSGRSPAAAMALGEAAARAAAAREPRTPAATTTEIVIHNFAFAPAVLTVPVGSPVTWVNRDDTAHRVVSANNQFPPSPTLDTGNRHTVTFAKAGTYRYYCALHPMMTGTIVIR